MSNFLWDVSHVLAVMRIELNRFAVGKNELPLDL
jgi:hypothetical protein